MSDHDTPEVGSGLSEAEVTRLANFLEFYSRGAESVSGLVEEVGGILADRLAAVEAERDHLSTVVDAARDVARANVARAESAEAEVLRLLAARDTYRRHSEADRAERDTALREVAEWRAATGEPDAEHARLSMDDLAATADAALAGVAERDALLAKVEALAEEWDRDDEQDMSAGWASDRLRAALANPDGGGQ